MCKSKPESDIISKSSINLIMYGCLSFINIQRASTVQKHILFICFEVMPLLFCLIIFYPSRTSLPETPTQKWRFPKHDYSLASASNLPSHVCPSLL